MKLPKSLTRFALLFGLTACSVSNAGLLSVSEQQINQYLQTRLAEKIPLQDSVGIPMLFQLDYNIQNLATKIGQTEAKKVEITGDIGGVLRVRGKTFDANITLNLDTVPYYDPEKGAIFLKEVQLKSWQVSPAKYQNELQMILPLLADGMAGVLNRMPIYTLDENKMKEALVKKFGKAIIVEKGELRLETTIF